MCVCLCVYSAWKECRRLIVAMIAVMLPDNHREVREAAALINSDYPTVSFAQQSLAAVVFPPFNSRSLVFCLTLAPDVSGSVYVCEIEMRFWS